ncbi:immunity 21 family protein [Streptomyces avidinii]|nr:immunity 21 family protein [Streptomyces avidinii]
MLGDEPSSTAFLPEHGVFVRWVAAESEADLLGSVGAALVDVVWEDRQVWDVPGPVALFDSAWPGSEVEPDNHTRVDLAAGRYEVRAALAHRGPRYRVPTDPTSPLAIEARAGTGAQVRRPSAEVPHDGRPSATGSAGRASSSGTRLRPVRTLRRSCVSGWWLPFNLPATSRSGCGPPFGRGNHTGSRHPATAPRPVGLSSARPGLPGPF